MAGDQDEAPAEGQPRGRERPRASPETRARAAELRKAGLPDRAVAAELGVDHRQVARWLGSSGRGAGRPRTAADPAEAVRLREQATRQRGLTWREIGAELGVSHEKARQLYGASKAAAVNDLERRRAEDDLDPGAIK